MAKQYSICPQCNKKGVYTSCGYITDGERKAMRGNAHLSLWSCRYCNFRTLSESAPAATKSPHQAALDEAIQRVKSSPHVAAKDISVSRQGFLASMQSDVRGNIGQGIESYSQNIRSKVIPAQSESGDWDGVKAVFSLECESLSFGQLEKIMKIISEGD